MIYDITHPINESLAVWPGDTPPSREMICDLHDGASVTLSTLHATVHLGAHADGPNHYGADAPAIDTRSLDYYLGPCQVIRAEARRGSRLGIDAVPEPPQAPRVLFSTGTFPDSTRFNEDYAALEPALIEWLAAHDVKLVGIDTPSVDLFDSKDLPAHGVCLRRDLAILEGLVLDEVPEGKYELIALPLKLAGFDASPVRAVLREYEDCDRSVRPHRGTVHAGYKAKS
jgi:arylformamidase